MFMGLELLDGGSCFGSSCVNPPIDKVYIIVIVMSVGLPLLGVESANLKQKALPGELGS